MFYGITVKECEVLELTGPKLQTAHKEIGKFNKDGRLTVFSRQVGEVANKRKVQISK